jgi:hypothetical protein
MQEMSRLQATFMHANWKETLPVFFGLTCAGCFFFGMNDVVTCFYCSGLLHILGSMDNPAIKRITTMISKLGICKRFM